MKAIVTTTINKPTKAILDFSKMSDYIVYVVGDLKTPHDLYEKDSNIRYLCPEFQEKEYSKISGLIGWNNIQRRNIGFIHAIKEGADVIISVDDDNIPLSNWGECFIGKDVTCSLFESDLYDPMLQTNHSEYWHRGYPPQLLNFRYDAKKQDIYSEKVKLQVGLWTGTPDVDAFSKIVNGDKSLNLELKSSFFARLGLFNSQNTWISKELMPYYCVFAHADRMDDIWGSIVLQKIKKISVFYSSVDVDHQRNWHDTFSDLQREIEGYRLTEKILYNWEKHLPDSCKKFFECYHESIINL